MSSPPNLLELAGNLAFVDEIFAAWRANPSSVDASWRRLFENGTFPAAETHTTNGHTNGTNGIVSVAPSGAPTTGETRFGGLFGLIHAYRARGHLEARLDPLDHLPRPAYPDLDPRVWGFTDADLDRDMPGGTMYGLDQPATLREIMQRLRTTYCGSIGVEMMHMLDADRRVWLQQRMEPSQNRAPIDPATQKHIYEKLVAAEALENFVHTKYVGAKRFSLEGSEALIPLLDLALERAGLHSVEEVVLGMAHRGRLNVLHNIMGKTAYDIFSEFEDIDPESMFGGGDVKYHLGFSSDHTTRAGHKLHLSLAFNPSHLEAVDPVVVGRVRAKQRRKMDDARQRVLGILVHGDAAFAGQGLVPETLNLSNLRGYRTGGTLHIIVNNQIGFTTSPTASRSTPYCTDIAKEILVPIFHVNGDDPEAVAQVVRLAMDFRREYQSDVVIDMLCYRKYGHNETDDPSFTQPLMYQKIAAMPTPRQVYGKRLIEAGVISDAEAEESVKKRAAKLDEDFKKKRTSRAKVSALAGLWKGYAGGPDAKAEEVDTGVAPDTLARIGERLTTIPDGFHPHNNIQKFIAGRVKMMAGEQPLDWSMGEALAFGTLVDEGVMIRLSGQDSRRGTFTQRHAVFVDRVNESEYMSLEHIRPGQGIMRIYDSPLSEAAVLGFEFGYSLDYPDGLVLWEAQFGDFVNGAQVIIDQFLTSSEDKWNRIAGLVLLLPHGYEGQGPEHSSARMERFLQLCAEDNIQVAYPTTPASYFHLLRRQVLRKWRKPLVVMTPKSLLRLPAATSSLADFQSGRFERILHTGETSATRILVCTGKVYYDLVKAQTPTTAILRLEQLYPLSDAALKAALDRYPNATEVVFVQEEPANMGAQFFVIPRLRRVVGTRKLAAASRVESASPATGSPKAHSIEQQNLVKQAFGPITDLETV
jgi:2-oxoglutarate dehydrogenase E1 component